jgi:hypothetical protein
VLVSVVEPLLIVEVLSELIVDVPVETESVEEPLVDVFGVSHAMAETVTASAITNNFFMLEFFSVSNVVSYIKIPCPFCD